MTYPDISRDPPRDPALAEMLRAAEQGTEAGADELRTLKAGIMARAQLPLARMRRQLSWWEYAARWATPAVPLAVAASIAMIWAVGSSSLPGHAPMGETAANSLPFLEDVLTSNVPDTEYQLLVDEENEMEALINFAFQEM